MLTFSRLTIPKGLVLSLLVLPILAAEPLLWATCVRENAAAIAAGSACAEREILRSCLMSPSMLFESLPILEWCLTSAGCTTMEAAAEARQIVKDCTDSQQPDEFRRRQEGDAMPSITTMPMRRATESSNPTTSPASLDVPSVCSTSHFFATEVCTQTTIDDGQVSDLPCSTTTIATLRCAATNVCKKDGSCRFRHDELTPSGVVITIVLSLVVGLTFAVIMFFYIREKLAKRMFRREQALRDVMGKQKAAIAASREQNYSDVNPLLG
ncbi:hypothetical protein GGR57DRAFT_472362 [Xylariaceae sp. FL1272]|nr:hypothetical protein GGR57DRAFT_472362 [Xylariaceae sp. FL1272]